MLLAAAAFGIGALVRLSEPVAPTEAALPGPVPTNFPSLSAELGRSPARILVTNNDEFAWTRCTLDLNAGVFGGGYSQAVGRIGPGGQSTARLTAFERAGGERFDPASQTVQVVDLHCDTPSGRAHHNGSF